MTHPMAKPGFVRLDAWLTLAQLAKRIGWSRWRTTRVMLTLNEQCGRMLLKDCARHDKPGKKPRPMWIVSVDKLRHVAPELFHEEPADGPKVGIHVERHNRPAAVQVGRDAA